MEKKKIYLVERTHRDVDFNTKVDIAFCSTMDAAKKKMREMYDFVDFENEDGCGHINDTHMEFHNSEGDLVVSITELMEGEETGIINEL